MDTLYPEIVVDSIPLFYQRDTTAFSGLRPRGLMTGGSVSGGITDGLRKSVIFTVLLSTDCLR